MRGDVLEVFPAYSGSEAYRDRVLRGRGGPDHRDRRRWTGEVKAQLEHVAIFPASHYVVPKEKMMRATENILAEMKEQVTFKSEDKLLEAQRIAERTNFDVEMMRGLDSAPGSRTIPAISWVPHQGSHRVRYSTIFPDDFLIIVDESHITLPQVRSMYFGDRSRKKDTGGLWLPSAVRT